MNYFFIDMENVGGSGLGDVRVVDIGDSVYLLYSQICKEIPLDVVMKLTTVKDTVFKCIKVDVGGKNALDFQLATFLGFVIGENIKEDELNALNGEQRKYYIVSKDTGFDYVCKFWQSKGIDVSRIPNLTGKKDAVKKQETKKKITVKDNTKKTIKQAADEIKNDLVAKNEIEISDTVKDEIEKTEVAKIEDAVENTDNVNVSEEITKPEIKEEIIASEVVKTAKKKNKSGSKKKTEKTGSTKKTGEAEKTDSAEKTEGIEFSESAEKISEAENEAGMTSLEELRKYIPETENIEEILTVFNKYKTKQGIHNGLNSVYKDSKKSGEIYKHLKPLFKEKKKS
ncbi:MAG: PIN domain-containing protein [Lachnospiraceae bacterium]|nr:PIN domain-containing protein [Lachnospiraceae bacterium]